MSPNKIIESDLSPRQRADRFMYSQFDSAYTVVGSLNCTAYVTDEPLTFKNRFGGKKIELSVGDKWAQKVFDCAWFHITGRLPEGCDESKTVFIINCGGEGLITDNNGDEKQSITCCASGYDYSLGEPVKRIVPFDNSLCQGSKVDFWIDCASNDLFGNMKNEARMAELYVARENTQTRALAYDIQVLLSVYDNGSDREFAQACFDAILKIVDSGVANEEQALAARALLRPLLETKNTGNTFTYSAIGHAHLDLAWLWPIRETIRKGGRTFSTQIKNIERYPGYVFGASQAQLYQWVKDNYPKTYKKVQALAKTPNWDVQGATWVEMDSNLIGGESMVRQFFYGKKFYRDEFGLDIKIFWVPDSFGYSACLPQVMQLAGVPYFLTQKISWNTYNKFPYHSFYWAGLDGTKVLSHMLPEDTYNSHMNGDLLTKGEKNYMERSISDCAMSLYGIGDGGAGPGYEHIERAVRFNDLRGIPKVHMEKSMDFFNRFDDGKTPYPTYSGELYLEKHQGTYTTRSDNKRFNRKCEFALRNYEMLMPLARKNGIELPVSHEELEALWKEVLLYQFHDILPGSSINRVYEETRPRYEFILNTLTNAAQYLLSKLCKSQSVVNLNSFSYDKRIKIDDKWYSISVPAFGAVSASPDKLTKEFSAACGYNYIENDAVKVSFTDGFITSVFDKKLKREFITDGKKAAVISQYTDDGDCWDMPKSRADYVQTKRDADCTDFITGKDGAKAFADAKYSVGDCTMSQHFYITDGSPAVYCDLVIDNNTNRSMLRIAFPFNVKTEECAFNIQFGHIKRRMTENNSVETAQFEVSGHKFADMSEDSCGISLINDCKYGYRCKNGTIDLNLVRSPVRGPGKNVDLIGQTVHYAVLPHSGSLGTDTYKEAYLLNNPLIVVDNDNKSAADECGFFNCDNDNIILETVKEAEDGNGIIVRLYNSSSEAQSADISVCGYSPVQVTDIPENMLSEKTDGRLSLHGFELINIRFAQKGQK